MVKRTFDLVVAILALVLLMPVLFLIAVAVRLSSHGPVLFKQIRVGRGGRDFILLKFRTMSVRAGSEAGAFDAGDTSRVTRVGAFLRATKLDELPQLWNVVRGDMSLVGPRPEVRMWVFVDKNRWSMVHSVRPGITDPASLVYRHEERYLASCPDPETTYREQILPRKLDMYEAYVRTRTFAGDVSILWRTGLAVVGGLLREVVGRPSIEADRPDDRQDSPCCGQVSTRQGPIPR
ncbi:sugar transferase [Singulisphaera sp. Ch08]|uniref:Sugar transferase n=1 Tax=Singulisphaera sp. Ch08 TaxID=3120278 RepID=A0AAU7CQT5_9BACT